MRPVASKEITSRLTADPGALRSLSDAAARNARDPTSLVERVIARIDAVEPAIRGWQVVDRDGARQQAEALAATTLPGPLHGVPVAIKDVIDVAGFQTRAGSRTRAQVAPATADAHVVTRLRQAGAIIIGKAHTTEFAFFDGAPPTRNPHDVTRTPGGSSAGPAAVVAAGMVPVSLGTQTAGSVSRPAAYCGIAAFKPSSQSWSSFGVVPFAPSFDTVGVFGYRTSDAACASRALMPDSMAAACPLPRQLRIGILRDPLLEEASPAVTGLTRDRAEALRRGGILVEPVSTSVRFATLLAAHLVVREYELGHVHGALLEEAAGMVTASLRDAVMRGGAITETDYLTALRELSRSRSRFWAEASDYDALLAPPTPDVAPVGMGTGDARFIIPWTALGGPIMSMPVGFDQSMPLGVMLVAAPGRDLTLLDIAEQVAPLIETPR